MAGDWLKVERATPEKPEVFAMAASLNLDPDIVFARLFKLWCWFDANTVDGNANGVTSSLLDRYIGVTGFTNAALQVGWLSVTPDGLSLPNFGYHNGETAKERSLTAKRVAKHRKSNANSNADTVTKNVTSPLAREEKRREEKKRGKDNSERTPKPAGFGVLDILATFPTLPEAIALDFILHRKAKKAPLTQSAWDSITKEIMASGWTPADALRETMARGWQGFKADWVKDKPQRGEKVQPELTWCPPELRGTPDDPLFNQGDFIDG